jgi:hypothetical protein
MSKLSRFAIAKIGCLEKVGCLAKLSGQQTEVDFDEFHL